MRDEYDLTKMKKRLTSEQRAALRAQIADLGHEFQTSPRNVLALLDALDQAEARLAEECRLNGMGSEREARLMARVGELERERDGARAAIEDRDQMYVVHVQRLEAERMRVIAERDEWENHAAVGVELRRLELEERDTLKAHLRDEKETVAILRQDQKNLNEALQHHKAMGEADDAALKKAWGERDRMRAVVSAALDATRFPPLPGAQRALIEALEHLDQK